MLGNAKKFSKKLKNFVENVGQRANRANKKIAKTAFKSIVDKSPVRTGSYVLSHRIGIKKLTSSPTRGRGFAATYVNQPKPGEKFQRITKKQFHAVKTIAMKQTSKIDKARYFSRIVIGNNIHYADNVEYLGWARTGPYHVYGRTIEEMKLKIPFIVKQIRVGSKGPV